MSLLSLGVVASSRKENEFRLPLHPAHLHRIAPDVRERIFLEQGYGERFGVADDALLPLVAGLRSREQLVAECDVLLLPKPCTKTSRSCARDRCCGDGRTACRTRR